MDFKQFTKAVPHHFGNGSEFRNLAGQGGRSVHDVVFSAKVKIEGKIFEIRLSNPHHPPLLPSPVHLNFFAQPFCSRPFSITFIFFLLSSNVVGNTKCSQFTIEGFQLLFKLWVAVS
jgi:hypothetical protein